MPSTRQIPSGNILSNGMLSCAESTFAGRFAAAMAVRTSRRWERLSFAVDDSMHLPV